MKIRLGTKNSKLAMLRTQMLDELLKERGHEVEVVGLPDMGDLESIGQLRLGLLRNDFDVVVHRLNRVPLGEIQGVAFGAIQKRSDARDVFVGHAGRSIRSLREGAKVAAVTPHRRAQVTAIRSGIEFVDMEPDLVTCLNQVAAGELDGLVASAADLIFLERAEEISEYFETLPEAGQGAIGFECRDDDTEMLEVLSEFHDQDTRICVRAERAVAEKLDLSDAATLGAFADRQGVLELRAEVLRVDGGEPMSLRIGMPTSEFHAVRCGHRLAKALRLRGAEDIGRPVRVEEPKDQRRHPQKLSDLRVLVVREPGLLSEGIQKAGVQVDAIPVQRRELIAASNTMDAADWVVFTSVRGVKSMTELGWTLPREVKIAAVGPGTARALEENGYTVDLHPKEGSGVNHLLKIWPEGTGKVLVLGSALLSPRLIVDLQRKGYTVQLIPIYTMQNVPAAPEALRKDWVAGVYDAVVIMSGSNAMAVDSLLGWQYAPAVVTLGESAPKVLKAAHVDVAKVSDSYDPDSVVRLLQELIDEQDD